MSAHACPGCGADADVRLFACRGCWSELPTEMRAAITATKGRPLLDPRRRSAVMAAVGWYVATDPLGQEA
jgi:hypothetical protein